MHVNSFKRFINQHLLDANNFMKQKITFYTRLNGKQYCYSGVQSITATRYRKYTFTWKIECVCVNKVRESKSYCNKGTIWKEIYVFYRNNFYYITKVFECKQQLPYNKSQGLHREFNIVSGVVLKHIFQKQTLIITSSFSFICFLVIHLKLNKHFFPEGSANTNCLNINYSK